MIEFLQGKVIRVTPKGVILDVQGVGYGVDIPLSLFDKVGGVGSSAKFFVYTKVREDEIRLFGFLEWAERETFANLVQINGVGPRVALAILSTLSLGQLRSAAQTKDGAILEGVPGIGKRTSEKIVIDLANKLDKMPSLMGAPDVADGKLFQNQKGSHANVAKLDDLKSALSNLGFKDKDLRLVVDQIKLDDEDKPLSALIKEALGYLQKGGPKRASPKAFDQVF